jgi:hypothetical protein
MEMLLATAGRSTACRMLCDIEVQDTPTVVTNDEKTIDRAKGKSSEP